MICRIATHEQTRGINSERKSFHAWMEEQLGLISACHVQDSATGKALSISFWDSNENLMALKNRVPLGGPIRMKPVSVELFDVAEEF